MHLSAKERAVLRIVQKDLPASLTPYADLAATCGLTEAEVLSLLQRLKSEGVIRRFGASIRHQRTGWTHNVMVAWKVSLEVLEECGQKAAAQERISHVYYRPVVAQNWPYNFYTMIHGKSTEECEEVIRQLMAESPLDEHLALYSLKELKKTSMTYFA